MFGLVGKVDMLASLFCLQRFKVCDSALQKELDNNEWEAGVKTMNGSLTACESNTDKYWLMVLFLFH